MNNASCFWDACTGCVHCLKAVAAVLNVAALGPLSLSTCFWLDTHASVEKQLFRPTDRILSTAILEVDVFGSRADNQAQNVLCLQKVYYDLVALLSAWSADGVDARIGAIMHVTTPQIILRFDSNF